MWFCTIHVLERSEDRKANKRIDSIWEKQIKAYTEQISAAQSIDSIKQKST
jgi:hypothetical protein